METRTKVLALVAAVILGSVLIAAGRLPGLNGTYMAGHDGVDQQIVSVNSSGGLSTVLRATDGTTIVSTNSASDDVANTGVKVWTNAAQYNFDGSTLDREFTCSSSATITVAAAATTEIVPLSGSTVIRVCSFLITGDTAATVATFVDGTGSNCATSPSNMTGAMRMVDEGNLSLNGGNGSIFRGRAGRAICLTAATGAVTGVLSYAQY